MLIILLICLYTVTGIHYESSFFTGIHCNKQLSITNFLWLRMSVAMKIALISLTHTIYHFGDITLLGSNCIRWVVFTLNMTISLNDTIMTIKNKQAIHRLSHPTYTRAVTSCETTLIKLNIKHYKFIDTLQLI